MKNIHPHKKIIALLLLPAISWLFFNSVYYRHLHESSSGLIISHAHPYDKVTDRCSNVPYASHNHTEEEFVLYDIISNTILPVLVALFVSLLLFYKLIAENRFVLQENIYYSDYYLLQQYRGPPTIFQNPFINIV
ncbi:MAG: hypothetical protein KOO66_12130 [Bacteroidales bacterium]|nr:hypothetical protein [Bacteroidales bacterium]